MARIIGCARAVCFFEALYTGRPACLISFTDRRVDFAEACVSTFRGTVARGPVQRKLVATEVTTQRTGYVVAARAALRCDQSMFAQKQSTSISGERWGWEWGEHSYALFEFSKRHNATRTGCHRADLPRARHAHTTWLHTKDTCATRPGRRRCVCGHFCWSSGGVSSLGDGVCHPADVDARHCLAVARRQDGELVDPDGTADVYPPCGRRQLG